MCVCVLSHTCRSIQVWSRGPGSRGFWVSMGISPGIMRWVLSVQGGMEGSRQGAAGFKKKKNRPQSQTYSITFILAYNYKVTQNANMTLWWACVIIRSYNPRLPLLAPLEETSLPAAACTRQMTWRLHPLLWMPHSVCTRPAASISDWFHTQSKKDIIPTADISHSCLCSISNQ